MNKAYRVVLWTMVAVGVVAMVVVLGATVATAPAVGAAGVAVGAVYLAVVLWALSRSRLWPGWRWTWIGAALAWGAGTSLLFVLASGEAVTDIATFIGWHESLMSFGGAYPEEIAKATGALVVCLSFRQFHRPWHGLMAGAVVGLGFEVNENIGYAVIGAMAHPYSDWAGFGLTWLQRVFLGPGLHICLSALAGWGIGWGLYAAGWSTWRRLASALGWLALAFVLHFMWNYMPASDAQAIATMVVTALILYPTLMWVWRRAARLEAEDPGYSWSTGSLAPVYALGHD